MAAPHTIPSISEPRKKAGRSQEAFSEKEGASCYAGDPAKPARVRRMSPCRHKGKGTERERGLRLRAGHGKIRERPLGAATGPHDGNG